MPQADMVRLFALFTAGRHADMAAAAQALTQRYPADGQGWKAWGISLLVQGQDALAPLQQAAALMPADAEVASNLGHVLLARNRWDEAEASLRRALHLQPAMAGAHCNLGNVLKAQGRWPEAEAAYRQALACNPALVEAHRALGALQYHQGQLDAAAASYRQALQLAPGHAHSQFHLGNVLADLGLASDAALAFRQALRLQPGWVQALGNLGVALLASGQAAEASDVLRQALVQQPDAAVLHSNLGNALMAQGQYTAALAAHQQALALAPGVALMHSNLAHLLKTQGQPELALPHLRQALALQEDSPDHPGSLALHSQLLFTQQYLQPADPAQALADARAFGQAAAQRARPFGHWPNAPVPDKRLRVGLLSADLRAHPVGYFSASVLAALGAPARSADPPGGGVELWAYAHQCGADAMRDRLRASCRQWHDVTGLDDAALARRIHDDGIDVLIDLSGHTLHNRLPVLAWRPAPVLVSWLGWCASTGLPTVDAFIGDPWITPPGAEAAFTEPIVRLPQTFLCFTPPDVDLPVGPLPAAAGTAGGITFGGFNHPAKMNDAVVALWSRVLCAVPGSRLLLQAAAYSDADVRRAVATRFAHHGVAPERLGLQPAQPRHDYLAGYHRVDIALDPFPYPGGTTSLEALWMGVPVLTLPGSTALSRQGLSILHNLGLHDWVASDADDYLDRAVRHAADLPALAGMRRGLRSRLLQSPLCDAPLFARHFEAALRGLWTAWCRRTLA